MKSALVAALAFATFAATPAGTALAEDPGAVVIASQPCGIEIPASTGIPGGTPVPGTDLIQFLGGTGHTTFTPSGQFSFECHISLPAGPPQAIVVDVPELFLAPDASAIIGTDCHVVASPSGQQTEVCHGSV